MTVLVTGATASPAATWRARCAVAASRCARWCGRAARSTRWSRPASRSTRAMLTSAADVIAASRGCAVISQRRRRLPHGGASGQALLRRQRRRARQRAGCGPHPRLRARGALLGPAACTVSIEQPPAAGLSLQAGDDVYQRKARGRDAYIWRRSYIYIAGGSPGPARSMAGATCASQALQVDPSAVS